MTDDIVYSDPELELPPDWELVEGTAGPGLPLIANRHRMEAIVGRELHPDIFDFAPWGHRLVVVRDAAVTITSGGIHIPDSARNLPAIGWVLSAGDQVGDPRHDFTGHSPLPRSRLLGCKVLFGQYAGQPVLVGEPTESSFESNYMLLTQNDVWGTVGEPPAEVPL